MWKNHCPTGPYCPASPGLEPPGGHHHHPRAKGAFACRGTSWGADVPNGMQQMEDNVPGGCCHLCEPTWPSSGQRQKTFGEGMWTPSKSRILKGSAAQWIPQPPMQDLPRPGHHELPRASDSLYKKETFPHREPENQPLGMM